MSDPAARIAAIVNRMHHMVDPLTDVFPKVTDQLRTFDNAVATIPNEKGKP